MCGIAGYCLKTHIHASPGELEQALHSIRKRGPDDEGVCLISRQVNTPKFYRTDHSHPALGALAHIHDSAAMEHDVALLHTRYAILDLSEKGHQPFVSNDGSVVAVFNGEIYNFFELKEELEALGAVFHTKCDTEVLVEGYVRFKDDWWPKLNGFWAMVLYDRRNRSLVLSRDRIGVAPLYYRETPQGLYFSSYIETLKSINGVKAMPNEDAVSGFLQVGFKDLDGSTYYQEIKAVPAATAVHIPVSKCWVSDAEPRPFWFLPDSRLDERDISFDDACTQFREIFFNAVDIRLRSDVKLAFELSGGLDSSSVVAAAATLGKIRVTTYTAKVQGADEEGYARSISAKYQVDYHVLDKIEDGFALNYGAFARLMEEPYDNPNAYTHYQMLKQMNAQGVKVVITGAGGDEVFAGYESSFWPKAYQEWRHEGATGLFRADWYEFCRRFKTVNSSYATLKHYCLVPLQKFMGHGASLDRHPHHNRTSTALKYHDQYPGLSFNEQRRFHFNKALLPFYMRSSDHFTMGIPVEHRFPLLDYRLIEFGMQMPVSYLFRNGWTKYILRKAMEPYLPAKIIWRRQKMGFQFPYRKYFTTHANIFGPVLKDYCSACRYEELIKHDPLLLWRILSTAIWMKNT